MAKRSDTRTRRPGDLAWTIAKLLLALALLGLVATQLRPEDMLRAWSQASWLWAVASALMFWASLVAMAVRYRGLLGGRLPLRDLLDLVVAQTVIGSLVASSAGVGAYLGMLLARHGIGLGRGALAYLLARLGDLLALLVGLALVSALLWGRLGSLQAPSLIILLALAGALGGVVLALTLRQPFVDALRSGAARLGVAQLGLVARPLARLDGVARTEPGWLAGVSGPLLLHSGLYTLFQFGYVYCALRTFGVQIDPSVVAFVLFANLLVAAVPVQILGGLGVVELTSLYLYALFGYADASLAASLLNIRIMFYAICLLTLLYLPLGGAIDRGEREHAVE